MRESVRFTSKPQENQEPVVLEAEGLCEALRPVAVF